MREKEDSLEGKEEGYYEIMNTSSDEKTKITHRSIKEANKSVKRQSVVNTIVEARRWCRVKI